MAASAPTASAHQGPEIRVAHPPASSSENRPFPAAVTASDVATIKMLYS
jgi:hypothetical protein